MLAAPARAAEIFPETRSVLGATLRLNGAGVRTATVFRVDVYAAALYLEQPGGAADSILRSTQRKLVEIRALRDVGAGDIGDAWRKAFATNCQAPCRMPDDVAAFLAAVRPSRVGQATTYVFGPEGVSVLLDGAPAGSYGPAFAPLLLATFIGPSPPTEALKRALLRGPS